MSMNPLSGGFGGVLPRLAKVSAGMPAVVFAFKSEKEFASSLFSRLPQAFVCGVFRGRALR